MNDARSSQGMKPRVDLQSYYDNLLSIAQTCRRRGIPLLLFSFSLPDDYSRAMQRAAQNSKAYYIDLEPAFEHAAKTLANNPTTDAQPDVAFERPHAAAVGRLFAGVYQTMFSKKMLAIHTNRALFIDPCHPTPPGHKIIAEQLAKAIVEKGLVKEDHSPG